MAHPTPDQDARESAVTAEVLASFEGSTSTRYREVMSALVSHLHDFAREVRLTEAEWEQGIDFLTRCGQVTDDRRQELILLSDVLGLSMLTVAVNQPDDPGATEATVFGPFFVEGAPEIEHGGDIAGGAKGQPCWVEGTVTDTDGDVVPHARLDVWEADDDGMYDVQHDGDVQQGRAHLFSDDQGRYGFWGVTPTPYPIPYDGPVGDLLTAAGRGPMRAPHLHFMVTAPGLHRLVTHIFVDGGDHLDSDAVFGVKDSLVVDFVEQPPGTATPTGREVEGTWTRARFDIVLSREDER